MKEVIRIEGKGTQSITPNRLVIEKRDDGKTDVYYSNKGDQMHGHTVLKADGSIEYARTKGGILLSGS